MKEKAPAFAGAFAVRMKGVEPPRLAALDPKSSVYCTKETQKHSLSITYVFCHFL